MRATDSPELNLAVRYRHPLIKAVLSMTCGRLVPGKPRREGWSERLHYLTGSTTVPFFLGLSWYRQAIVPFGGGRQNARVVERFCSPQVGAIRQTRRTASESSATRIFETSEFQTRGIVPNGYSSLSMQRATAHPSSRETTGSGLRAAVRKGTASTTHRSAWHSKNKRNLSGIFVFHFRRSS